MKNLIAISALSILLFSCSEEKQSVINVNLDSTRYLKSPHSNVEDLRIDDVVDCQDNGTPYASSYICGKEYIVGIYNSSPIESSKKLAVWQDSSYVTFYNKIIKLDSAANIPAANTSTDYVLLVNTTDKTVKKALWPTSTSYTAGNGINISSGVISLSKKREVSTGTTSGSGGTLGTYTYTYSGTYSAAPNVQATLQGDYPSYNIQVVSKTTTSCTVKVYSLTSILSLGLVPQYTGVNGIVVDVEINEK